MHILIHILIWAFRAKGKGKLVLPFFIASLAVVFVLAWAVSSVLGEKRDSHTENVLSGVALVLTGILIYLFTRNYHLSPDGEKIYFEEEGVFMSIGVSYWYGIFIGLGLIFIAGTLGEQYFSS